VEDEVAAIARQYAQGIVNCMRPSSGVRVEDFEPILAEACKKSAIVAALHAGEIIEKLRDERNEGMRWLRKYQARYHGAEHAQKLWNHVEEFLNRKR
jgi:hypothetical protein